MNKVPAVSVVIPCYNTEKYLREAIGSVLAQTALPIEIIVIDDGSTDKSVDIAESFGPPVRVIRQKHQGESVARNRGIDEAKGDWIAFLDADDIWKANKLESQLKKILIDPNLICIHSHYYFLENKIGIPPINEVFLEKNYQPETLITGNFINSSTAVVKKSTSVRFPVWCQRGEDIIYFVELSLCGRFEYVPEPLVGYRVHDLKQYKGHKEDRLLTFQSCHYWLMEIAPMKIGVKRSEALQQILYSQVIDWVCQSKWRRRWSDYWYYRDFAKSLDWKGDVPKILTERIYPSLFYRIKDIFDDVLMRVKKENMS
jgi:glycosyltransferase involved in cell wall biosynthesis